MMKKIHKIIIILLFIFCLSGCYNYEEINNYAIVSGISIDQNKEDNSKYDVGIQIMNAKKDEEADNSLITFYKASGNTIFESLEKIMLDSPKEIYLGHNEVIVISETLLKEKDPLNFLDFFMRNPQVEKDSLVMIAKDSNAYEVLKIITPLETIPSRNLKSSLNIADKYSGTLTIITIDEFISNLINDGVEAVLPAVTIDGKTSSGDDMQNISESDPKTKLKFETLGFFQNNKLKDYLSKDESMGYNFLAGTPSETYINVKCDDSNYASLKISNSKLKEEMVIKDGKPKVSINDNITADLAEYNCKADFIKNNDIIEEIEKNASKKIKELMNKSINKLYVENKSDVLKYGLKFYQKKYKEMEKYGYKAEEIINNINFDINVNVEINSSELSIKSVKENK